MGAPAGLSFAKSMTQLMTSHGAKFKHGIQTPDRHDLGVLTGAANGVGGGQRRSGGGPRTP